MLFVSSPLALQVLLVRPLRRCWLLIIAVFAALFSLAADPPARIDSFQGPYRFLSNFWPVTVVYEREKYPSVEHAYQAAKTLSLDDRKRIASLPTAAEAKNEGRKLARRPDW